jgi:hypothetical protein
MASEAEIKTIVTANIADFEAKMRKATVAMQTAEKKFSAANKRSESGFKAVTGAARALAASFAVGAAVQYGRSLLELGDRLKTLSERTGASAKFFSALQPEIENAGSSLEEFGGSLNKMNVIIGKAASGQKAASDAFRALGLNVAEISKLDTESQFLAIATAISKLSTQSERSAAAMSIFGGSASSLIPILNKGGEELRRMADEQVRLGLAMSDETAARLDDIGNSINTFAIRTKNFSAEALIKGLDAINIGLIGIAENGILAAKYLGLIDKDVAAAAIAIGEERIATMGKPVQGPKQPRTGTDSLFDTEGADKAADNAKKLSDELYKLQRQTGRDVYTSGMAELSRKLLEVDYQVADLAKQYKTELTPAMKQQIETIKENVANFDALQKQERLIDSLGDAFSDAFEQGIMGAESFSDVLGSLAKQIEKIALRTFVTEPLNRAFGDIFSSIGADIFGPMGSFATGTANVPRDMYARLHKGEQVVTRSQVQSGINNSSSGLTVNVINNTPATVKTGSNQNGDITVMIDQAVAQNMGRPGSLTNQALRAQGNRSVTRR